MSPLRRDNTQSIEQITITDPLATPGDLVRWTDNSTGADDRFYQPDGVVAIDGTWTGFLVYKDEPLTVIDQDYQGRLQIGSTHFLWTVSQFVKSREYPPVLDSVALVENNPHTAPRFTDQTFTATATLSDQGLPTSTKKFDAYVKGEITVHSQFDEPLDSSSVNQITRTWSNDCTSPDGASALAFNGFLDASVGSGQWTGSGSGGSVVWDTGAYPNG